MLPITSQKPFCVQMIPEQMHYEHYLPLHQWSVCSKFLEIPMKDKLCSKMHNISKSTSVKRYNVAHAEDNMGLNMHKQIIGAFKFHYEKCQAKNWDLTFNFGSTWIEASTRSRGFWTQSSQRFSLDPDLEFALEFPLLP